MLQELQSLFIRDLGKLKDEVSLFSKEEDLWKIQGEVKNSAGNLCLHLVGNLNHFIGAVILETGYIRDREFEFGARNVPQIELIRKIEETIRLIEERFMEIEPGILQVKFPVQVFGYDMTTSYFLMHLSGHLNYHLGQINYLRRLLH